MEEPQNDRAGAGPAARPRCPQCAATIAEGWQWCHACGYDPDALTTKAAALLELPDDLLEPDARPEPPAPPVAAVPDLPEPDTGHGDDHHDGHEHDAPARRGLFRRRR